MFGLYVQFRAHPGQRDALIDILLKAADSMRDLEGCYVYIINSVPTNAEAIWVTEIWRSQTDQEASLSNEATKALIMSSRPLIAEVPQRIQVAPIGGKGLSANL